MVSFSGSDIVKLQELAARIPGMLKQNLLTPEERSTQVLLAGADYTGCWLEHNQDCFFAADFYPDEAWETQKLFMDYQLQCGLIPYCVRFRPFRIFFSQLQTVWPFARCALEVAKKVRRPEADFAAIYDAGCRYDQWLALNRDRNGLDLVEMYCSFDTGHDNSPRVKDGGIANQTEGAFAGNMPDLPCMPLIAADLSATRYGGAVALAELAEMLGKKRAAQRHRATAERIKEAMFKYLYDAEDEFFYDRSPSGLRKYRTEHITRLFLNGVVTPELFDRIYARYFEDENEFFTPYPFPSVSVSDPSFCGGIKPNCWGGNTQMLTLLRALLWMDKYGRGAELEEVMRRVLRAYLDYDNPFAQELHPFTGAPLGNGENYTPAMLFIYIAVQRSFGK